MQILSMFGAESVPHLPGGIAAISAGSVLLSKMTVISSGFGGLGAAVRLAARGHQVDLYEQRDKLGGRAYVYEIDGFTLDAGPTLIAESWIFDEIWHATGRRRQGYFRLVPCDPLFRLI